MSTPPFYACDYSAQIGEQLFATAPRAEHWLLLEYPRPWSGKAYEDSSIPPNVKSQIDGVLAQMPHSRLQMIAQGSRESLTDLTLYVIRAAWERQHIRRITLPTYEALLDLPLADIAAGRAEMGVPVAEPLYIVCTNGKRDVCCARHGLPIYNALRAAGAQAWQCNHIGGHRLAGTLVAFPHGVYYGRVTADDVPALLAAVGNGEMLLERVRGRACLEAVGQAA
ncbi:MAG: sucrase ferredoxin, partial [Chloroflexota bacterium]|nr:sucrase ferredoxin [Chloroflexota bacterium]